MNRFGFNDVVSIVGPPHSSIRGEILGRILSWRADRSAYGVMSLDDANVYVVPADQLRLVLRRESFSALVDQAYPVPSIREGSRWRR